MATTAVIAEMIVIGFFASIWMSAIAMQICDLSCATLADQLNHLKDFSSLLMLIGLIVWYQIGWLVNGLAFAIEDVLIRKRVRDRQFVGKHLDYETVRATVYQKASAELRADFGADRGAVRLLRAGTLNFSIIGLCSLWCEPRLWGISTFAFAVATWCGVLCYFRYGRYYRRIIAAYEVIQSAEARS